MIRSLPLFELFAAELDNFIHAGDIAADRTVNRRSQNFDERPLGFKQTGHRLQSSVGAMHVYVQPLCR